MADQTIQATESMVGANHPTLADTLNRHGLVEHKTDGTHKAIALASAGVTANVTELNYVDGVTSSIQTQLDAKCGNLGPSGTGTFYVAGTVSTENLTIAGNPLTATSAEINKLAGTPAGLTATEIGYLDGVTSAIQTQLNTLAGKFNNKATTTLSSDHVSIVTSSMTYEKINDIVYYSGYALIPANSNGSNITLKSSDLPFVSVETKTTATVRTTPAIVSVSTHNYTDEFENSFVVFDLYATYASVTAQYVYLNGFYFA